MGRAVAEIVGSGDFEFGVPDMSKTRLVDFSDKGPVIFVTDGNVRRGVERTRGEIEEPKR
jgi:hypothetical protein